MRHGALGHHHRRKHVRPPLGIEALERRIREGPRIEDARREHHPVQRAELFHGPVNEACGRFGIREVNGGGDASAPGRSHARHLLVQATFIPAHEQHGRASRPKARTVAAPMPELAPVTITGLPASPQSRLVLSTDLPNGIPAVPDQPEAE